MQLSTTQPVPLELSPWLLLAVASVVTLLALVILRPRLRRPPAPPPVAARLAEPSVTHTRSVERDIQALMHELSEMARRVGTQLDARSARLEQLIREADARIEQLGSGPSIAAGSPASEVDHNHEPTLAVFSDAAPTMGVDPRHTEIYKLQDQGLTLGEIATRLRRPHGEIELIVALRPRTGSPRV